MGTLTVNATNGQTVAAGASYTVPYPAGKSAADYLTTGAKITTSDGSIYSATVSLGGSSITITNPTGRAIASGGFDYLDLDNAGIVARFNSLGEGAVLLGPKNTEASLVSSENNLLTGVSGISIDNQFVPIAPGPDDQSVSFLGTNGRSITINTAHVPDNTDLQILGPLNLLQESTSLTYNATTTPTTPTGSTGLTITEPGTYILSAKVKTTLAGTTWAAAANVGALLHRTNNTPADLTNSGTTALVPAMTLLTMTGPTIFPGETVYTTSNSDDVINVKAFVSTLPSAGALQVISTHIMAKRVTM